MLYMYSVKYFHCFHEISLVVIKSKMVKFYMYQYAQKDVNSAHQFNVTNI